MLGVIAICLGAVLPLMARLSDVLSNQRVMVDLCRENSIKLDQNLALGVQNANRLRQIKSRMRVPDTDVEDITQSPDPSTSSSRYLG